jgi:hypothetical protein
VERAPYLIELEASLTQAGDGVGRIVLISGKVEIGRDSRIEALVVVKFEQYEVSLIT